MNVLFCSWKRCSQTQVHFKHFQPIWHLTILFYFYTIWRRFPVQKIEWLNWKLFGFFRGYPAPLYRVHPRTYIIRFKTKRARCKFYPPGLGFRVVQVRDFWKTTSIKIRVCPTEKHQNKDNWVITLASIHIQRSLFRQVMPCFGLFIMCSLEIQPMSPNGHDTPCNGRKAWTKANSSSVSFWRL